MTRTSILREECKRQKQGQNSSYQLTQVLIYSLNSTDLIIENCLTELDRTDRKLISLLYTRPKPEDDEYINRKYIFICV